MNNSILLLGVCNVLLIFIAVAKGNQILGLIRRNIVYKENELIIPLYKTIVRPHLEYCIQA